QLRCLNGTQNALLIRRHPTGDYYQDAPPPVAGPVSLVTPISLINRSAATMDAAPAWGPFRLTSRPTVTLAVRSPAAGTAWPRLASSSPPPSTLLCPLAALSLSPAAQSVTQTENATFRVENAPTTVYFIELQRTSVSAVVELTLKFSGSGPVIPPELRPYN